METNTIAILQALQAMAAARPPGSEKGILDQILVVVILALPAVLAYLKAREVGNHVKEVQLSINSRLDKWLAVERDQGVSDGRNQARLEAGHQAAAVALSTQEATTRAAAGRMTEDQLRDIVAQINQQLGPRVASPSVAGASRSDPPDPT